jgi:hypothetical protein
VKTKKLTGLELAASLCEEHSNEWGGGDVAEAITAAKLAVVVERDQDSWVLAAQDWDDVAGIALTCLHSEYETEFISEVWDVATGEQQTYKTNTIVTVVAPDGTLHVKQGG